MLRFLLQKSSPEVHEDVVSDYTDFRQTVRHGFPSRVSCFAYDDVLKILAVGNLEGDVNIYGGGGFMWSVAIPNKKGLAKSAAHMYFACGLGILIVLCRDSTFVRVSIEGAQINARSVLHETRLKKITSCCMLQRPNHLEALLLIGTVSGNVFGLDINTLELSEYIVFEDCLLQRIPEEQKQEKYPVDLLSVCPTNPRLTTMVFNHCLVLAYDSSTNEVLGTNLLDVPCKYCQRLQKLQAHSQKQGLCRRTDLQIRSQCMDVSIGETKTKNHPAETQNTVIYLPHFVLDFSKTTFLNKRKTRNITWSRDGSRFIIALHDGSYAACDPSNAAICDRPANLFGPFPCIPTKKAFFAETSSTSDRIVLFSGGMPHASYGERFVVTARQGDRTCVFDFPSPVVDFTLSTGDDGYHKCALVLTENELVCIDLTDRCWRVIPTEQIFPLHASQRQCAAMHVVGAFGFAGFTSKITTSAHCAHVEEHVWAKLNKLSGEELRRNRKFSSSAWPLNAKVPNSDDTRVVKEATKRQLYITGHENGTVRIWSVGHAVMQLLFVIDTRNEFHGFAEEEKDTSGDCRMNDYDTDSTDDEFQITCEWPPFKKVGDYDPFCDDAGLSIQRLAFDEKSGQVVVGCRGGHVLVYSLEESEKVSTPQRLCIEICEPSKLSSPARNSRPLPIRLTTMKYHPGYQPFCSASQNKSMVVQLQPALAVSAVAVLSPRHLVAAANEYGFALIDINKQTILLQNTLVNQSDMQHVGTFDDALSRFKSMKKSIRQTFRRKKKTPAASLDNTIGTMNSESSAKESTCQNISKVFSDQEEDEVVITKPVERLIEERGVSPLEAPMWFIRCLKFLSIPVLGIAGVCDVLVVGTNGGKVIIHTITDQPRAEDVCKLLKTIVLRHAAPILHVDVILEPGTRQTSSTRLLIVTEEQIRSFYLPNLKLSRYKVKLTSTEGLRIRKAAIVALHNKHDLSNCESFATILNNHGEVAVYSLSNPKKTERFSVVKSTDIAGMSSMLITPYGEILYLRQGGSELQRATISEHSLPWTMPGQGVKWPETAVTREA